MDPSDPEDTINNSQDGLNWEKTFLKFRYPIVLLLVGIIFAGFGFLLFQTSNETKVEILGDEKEETNSQITVEAAGAFEKPGVYQLPEGSRVEDLFILAGGTSVNADRLFIERTINRAAKLTDGQKVFIPDNQSNVLSANNSTVDQSVTSDLSYQGSGLTNINSASKNQLEELPGIGPVYAQSIIDHRPYSTVEELLSKGALKTNVYEKVKDSVSVY